MHSKRTVESVCELVASGLPLIEEGCQQLHEMPSHGLTMNEQLPV
jgi:hypothetical protein